jgi:hypothetical protein
MNGPAMRTEGRGHFIEAQFVRYVTGLKLLPVDGSRHGAAFVTYKPNLFAADSRKQTALAIRARILMRKACRRGCFSSFVLGQAFGTVKTLFAGLRFQFRNLPFGTHYRKDGRAAQGFAADVR